MSWGIEGPEDERIRELVFDAVNRNAPGVRIGASGGLAFPTSIVNGGLKEYSFYFDLDDSDCDGFTYKTAGSGSDRVFFQYLNGAYDFEVNESGGINPDAVYTTAKLGRSRWLCTFKLDEYLRIYRNGKLVAEETSISSNSFALSSAGSHQFESAEGLMIYEVQMFSKALEGTEIQDVFNGRLPSYFRGVDGTIAYTSNFSVDADGFSANGGAVAGNIDFDGETNVMRFTVNSSTGNHNFAKGSVTTSGQKARAKIRYNIPSSNSHIDSFIFSGDNTEIETVSNPTLDAWTEYSVEYVADSTAIRIKPADGGVESFQDASGDDVFYVTDIEVVNIGQTLGLYPEGINETNWLDSNNGSNHATYTTCTAYNLRPLVVNGRIMWHNPPTSSGSINSGELWKNGTAVNIKA